MSAGVGRRRGISLLELLMAVTIGTTVTLLLASTSLVAAKTFNKVTQVSRMHTFGRRTFDQFVADVQKADLSLNKFPTWTQSPWFTAKDDKCVILRQPVFKADKTVDSTRFSVVIYRLVTPAQASDGPFVLERTVCPLQQTPTLNSASRGPSLVVAKNIKRVNWNQMTSQTFWGDQSTKVYTLTTVPAADTPEIKLQALIGGVNRLDTGHVTLSGRTLTLFQAMQWGVALDVTYHIEPTTLAFANGSNGATAIFTRFVFEPRWTANDLSTKTREITLSAMPTIDNKVD